MGYYDSWNQYIEQLNRMVEKQNEKMKMLEKRINKLETDMESNKQKPSTNIEKIEYKFDQLKIETLEGTLNIGFTPGSGMGVEDLSIPQEPFPPKQNTGQAIKENIVNELGNYLTKEGPSQLQSIAREYNQTIDETYQQFILQDVQKQLGDRVSYYMDQSTSSNGVVEEEHRNQIVDQIKQEINQSLHHFLQKQTNKGDGNS
ncbi:spore germination protein GerPC [Pontibacillus yanchengensis]|uniref:Spore gernimation protein GerPC n=1 Tax=Pontibacillus yanchengensis Y32 TaxID=1385514 RepID=A0A0A2TCG6_9BACI|nr:spore germination protein GerPC [Pontibacillus yanchengensis]KGP72118.1 spore gernimation protein GerPC [Pontibacillus yanchengensis Y32]